MANGYLPIPIRVGSKAPAEAGWQNARFTAAEITARRDDGAGVGILTGQGPVPLVGLDLDVSHPEIVAGLVTWCRDHLGHGCERVGAAPRVLLLYRASEAGWAKASSAAFFDPADPVKPSGKKNDQRIEALGHGQQFVAYAMHPDTGRPYHWPGLFGGPDGFPAEALPIVTREAVDALFVEFDRLAKFHGLDRIAERAAPGASVATGEAHELAALVPREGVTPEQAREVLALVPNDAADYDTWARVGMALHHESAGEAWGLDAWREWSRRASKHVEGVAERKWRSFGKGGHVPVTWGTLKRMARVATGGAASAKASAIVPKANHYWTDQANAERLAKHYGDKMLAAGEQWFAWDGKRWAPDDARPVRLSLTLSELVKADHEAWRAANPDTGDDEWKKIDDGWRAWARRSEMRPTIGAALALLKKLARVGFDRLDANPWLLNCQNGTVDLRTGELRPHDPADYLTKITPTTFDPAAKAPTFARVLLEVTGEDRAPLAPVAEFLRRWFGYCATGSTREQKFMVHWGAGANGKSTLLDAIADALGPDYAGAAAPGLLVSSGRDRHPTEIADLRGRRMVTAAESGEGGTLREEFVKAATGGDKLKARMMRQDFFEFAPTHKLQLMTNHKPAIRGADFGIWRRVLLVPYLVRFGTPQEIVAGTAQRVKDSTVKERLAREVPGILTAIVAGAVEWYRHGLNPPESVLAAVEEYRRDEDRVAQFVAECCKVGPELSVPLAGTLTPSLYQAYGEWCRESGMHALSKKKFLSELERVVPRLRKGDAKESTPLGQRRSFLQIGGVGLL